MGENHTFEKMNKNGTKKKRYDERLGRESNYVKKAKT